MGYILEIEAQLRQGDPVNGGYAHLQESMENVIIAVEDTQNALHEGFMAGILLEIPVLVLARRAAELPVCPAQGRIQNPSTLQAKARMTVFQFFARHNTNDRKDAWREALFQES